MEMMLLFFHEYKYMYNPTILLTRRSRGPAPTLPRRPDYSCLVQTLVLGLLGHRVARVVLVLVGCTCPGSVCLSTSPDMTESWW